MRVSLDGAMLAAQTHTMKRSTALLQVAIVILWRRGVGLLLGELHLEGPQRPRDLLRDLLS